MNWYKTSQSGNKKRLIVMRGLPGSGKSTKAKQLGENGIILSTDDFWDVAGEYKYDKERIAEAHQWNQQRAKQFMQHGETLIVIDNTNVNAYEMKPYVQMAQRFGYDIEFAESDAPWKNDIDQLMERGTHNVPRETYEEMQAAWMKNPNVDDILSSKSPWED